MHDFSYFMFFVVYVCFSCLVFVPVLYSFDYRYNLGSLDYSLKYNVQPIFSTFHLCFVLINAKNGTMNDKYLDGKNIYNHSIIIKVG